MAGQKQWSARPNIEDVRDAQVRVFEQVRGLSVDLERVDVIERVEIEAVTHLPIVLQATTEARGHGRLVHGDADGGAGSARWISTGPFRKRVVSDKIRLRTIPRSQR